MGTSYRDLIAWQKAVQFVAYVYSLTRTFPHEEMFGLVAQLRRAAVSVASNIAEGQGRLTSGEFRHFLGLARGSLLEVETQFEIAHAIGYINSDLLSQILQRSGQVGMLINGLLGADLNRPGEKHRQHSATPKN